MLGIDELANTTTLERPVSTSDINDALRTYLGSDVGGGVLPYSMEDRVRERYRAEAPTLLVQIKAILGSDGLLDHNDEGMRLSLQEIASLVAQRVRARRPDLEDDVCRAIGNYFSYSYR